MNIHVCRNQKCRATWVSTMFTSIDRVTTQLCPDCIPLFSNVMGDMPIAMVQPADPDVQAMRIADARTAPTGLINEVRRDISRARQGVSA